jgi:hypothetical protein
MWISLTFHRHDPPNNLDSGSRKHSDLVDDERSQFYSLPVDESVQIIVEDWSWNEKLSQGEGREFHSFSISEIAEIIVERVSRK